MRRYVPIVCLGLAAVAITVWRCRREPTAPSDATTTTGSNAMRARRAASMLARGSIEGTVTTETGPVGRARVCAVGDGKRWSRQPVCTMADDRGGYMIGELEAASYVVSASARGFEPALHGERGQHEQSLTPGERKAGVDIKLRGGGVEITGTVIDASGGPIAKALVWSDVGWGDRARAFASTESGADGTFTLWVLQRSIDVHASAQGYVANDVLAAAPSTVTIALTPAASVSGRVLDGVTNAAIDGAEIFASSPDYDGHGHAVSNIAGEFRLEGLVPGRYALTAMTDNGYGSFPGSALVGLGQDASGTVIKLWPAHRVEGRVVVSTTKAPCKNAWVGLHDHQRDQRGAMEGRGDMVSSRGLLPGTYRVEVSCTGYLSRDEYPSITIADRDIDGLVWEVDPGATIKGRVLGPAGTTAELSVSARRGGEWQRGGLGFSELDDEGRYEISGLVPGTYRVSVLKRTPDYWRERASDEGAEVEVAARAIVERDITLERTATITGIVVDSQGQPQDGVTVIELKGSDTTTDSAGRFRLRVRPGEARVVAYRQDDLRRLKPSQLAERATVANVAVNQPTELRLVVPTEAAVIEGVVHDVDGKPVSDAYVYTGHSEGHRVAERSWMPWEEPPELTAADGSFRVDGLAPGTYSVHAFRKGGGEAVALSVATGTRVTLQIRRTGSIKGVVRASKPITLLKIELREPHGVVPTRTESFYRSDGAFVLEDVPDGRHRLVVIADGVRTMTEVELAVGETKTLALEVASPITLTGRVVELDTKAPVAGVRMLAQLDIGTGIYSTRDPGIVVTDGTGRFSIPNVPIGKVIINGDLQAPTRSGSIWMTRTITGSGSVDIGDLALVRERLAKREWPGEHGIKFTNEGSWPRKSELVIMSIDPAGPAAKSGLQIGDTITSIDGHDIRGENEYLSGLLRAPAGTKVTLGTARGGVATITLAPRKPYVPE